LPSRKLSTLVSEMFWNRTMRIRDFAGAVYRAHFGRGRHGGLCINLSLRGGVAGGRTTT
jgi:hypothetical protein